MAFILSIINLGTTFLLWFCYRIFPDPEQHIEYSNNSVEARGSDDDSQSQEQPVITLTETPIYPFKNGKLSLISNLHLGHAHPFKPNRNYPVEYNNIAHRNQVYTLKSFYSFLINLFQKRTLLVP